MKLLAVFLLCCLAAASASQDFWEEYGSEIHDKSFIDKAIHAVRERLQKLLNELKDKIKGKEHLFEELKEKFSEAQEKIHELVKVAKEKFIEKVKEVSQYLQDLYKNVLKIVHKDEVEKIDYIFYEAQEETVFDRLAHRIKEGLEKMVEKVLEQVEKYKDIAYDIKDKVLAIKLKLQEIPKAGAEKLLEIAQNLKEQLKKLLVEVVERVAGKEEEEIASYALYESREEGFLENIANRIKAQLERFLTRIVELVNKYTDIADSIREKVVAIKEKLEEIPKAGFNKLLEIAQSLKQQLQNLLKEAVAKIADKHEEESSDTSLYDAEGGLFERIAEKIRKGFEAALAKIEERLATYKGLALEFKDKIVAIKDKLQELAQTTGPKLAEILENVRVQLKELLKDALSKIREEQVVEYSVMDVGEGSLLYNFVRGIRERLQAIVDAIKERLEKHKDVFETIRTKLEEIQEGIDEMSQAALSKVVSLAHVIREKLAEIVKSISARVGVLDIQVSFADGVRKPGDSSRRRLQTHLDELKKRVAKYPEVLAQYKQQLDELQQKVDAVADLSGIQLALTSSKVQRDIGRLRQDILDDIGTRPPKP